MLFLHDKHLTLLGGVQLEPRDRLVLAAQAQLPLLHLAELGWYQGFHELVIYPDDFLSPSATATTPASSMSGTPSTAARPGIAARWYWPGPACRPAAAGRATTW